MIRIAGFSSVEAPSEGNFDAIVGATDVEQIDEDELQYNVKRTVNPARVRRARGCRELRESKV